MTTLQLTDEEAKLFMEFQKRHEVIGYVVGYMESLNMFDLKNMEITLNMDNEGIIKHMSLCRHYRK